MSDQCYYSGLLMTIPEHIADITKSIELATRHLISPFNTTPHNTCSPIPTSTSTSLQRPRDAAGAFRSKIQDLPEPGLLYGSTFGEFQEVPSGASKHVCASSVSVMAEPLAGTVLLMLLDLCSGLPRCLEPVQVVEVWQRFFGSMRRGSGTQFHRVPP